MIVMIDSNGQYVNVEPIREELKKVKERYYPLLEDYRSFFTRKGTIFTYVRVPEIDCDSVKIPVACEIVVDKKYDELAPSDREILNKIDLGKNEILLIDRSWSGQSIYHIKKIKISDIQMYVDICNLDWPKVDLSKAVEVKLEEKRKKNKNKPQKWVDPRLKDYDDDNPFAGL